MVFTIFLYAFRKYELFIDLVTASIQFVKVASSVYEFINSTLREIMDERIITTVQKRQ